MITGGGAMAITGASCLIGDTGVAAVNADEVVVTGAGGAGAGAGAMGVTDGGAGAGAAGAGGVTFGMLLMVSVPLTRVVKS